MIELYHESMLIGAIRGAGDELCLTYHDGWLARRAAYPISVTLPLGTAEYRREAVLPWLANVLPEIHLGVIGQRLKVSPQDILALVKIMGRDMAGAVSVGIPSSSRSEIIAVRDGQFLEDLFEELSANPFLVGVKDVSMCLAGAQEKLPVYISPSSRSDKERGGESSADENCGALRVGIPVKGTPSTHIIKPSIRRLPASVQNEAFCMMLAKRCGLDVANVNSGLAGKRPYLVVERYDRVIDRKGVVRRIHQEDFCQLLGYLPTRKFEVHPNGGQPGPGLDEMFSAIGKYASPGERTRLLDAVIFNVLICNTDAHAKNYSIIMGQGGRVRLAPLYDLLCGAVYPGVAQQLAQRINGKDDPRLISGNDWKALANQVGLSSAGTVRRVAQLVQEVKKNADGTARDVARMPTGDHPMLNRIRHEVKKMADRIERQL